MDRTTGYLRVNIKTAVEELIATKCSLRSLTKKYGYCKTTLSKYRRKYLEEGYRFDDGYEQDLETINTYLSLPGFRNQKLGRKLNVRVETFKREDEHVTEFKEENNEENELKTEDQNLQISEISIQDPIPSELSICRFCMCSLIDDKIEISQIIHDQFESLIGYNVSIFVYC
jgi:hypothetical protein